MKRRPGEAVHDHPRVRDPSGSRVAPFRVRQNPLVLPLVPELRLQRPRVRREQCRRVVVVVLADQVPAGDVLYLDPAGREGGDGADEFPVWVAAVRGDRLRDDEAVGDLVVDCENVAGGDVVHGVESRAGDVSRAMTGGEAHLPGNGIDQRSETPQLVRRPALLGGGDGACGTR